MAERLPSYGKDVVAASPRRIQRKRMKGWRMPAGAVYVGRGSKWGSPFKLNDRSGLARVPAVDHPGKRWEYEGRISGAGMRHDYHHPGGFVTRCDIRYLTPAESVACYRALLMGDGRWPLNFTHQGGHYPHVSGVRVLAGRDLVCWCPLEDARGNRVPCHADVLLELANSKVAL